MIWTLIRHEAAASWRQLLVVPGLAVLLIALAVAAFLTRIEILLLLAYIPAAVLTLGLVPIEILICAAQYWKLLNGRRSLPAQVVPVRATTLMGAALLWAYMVWLVALSIAALLAALPIVCIEGVDTLFYYVNMLALSMGSVHGVMPMTVMVAVVCLPLIAYSVMTISSSTKLGWGGPVVGMIGAALIYMIGAAVATFVFMIVLSLMNWGSIEFFSEGLWSAITGLVDIVRSEPEIFGVACIPWTIIFTVVLGIVAWRRARQLPAIE